MRNQIHRCDFLDCENTCVGRIPNTWVLYGDRQLICPRHPEYQELEDSPTVSEILARRLLEGKIRALPPGKARRILRSLQSMAKRVQAIRQQVVGTALEIDEGFLDQVGTAEVGLVCACDYLDLGEDE